MYQLFGITFFGNEFLKNSYANKLIIPYYKFTFFKTLQSLANQTDKRFKVYIR
jgi:hypothetical protein